MTDHSKAKAGKAPNKNHKVVHIVHAGVKAATKDLNKGAGTKTQKAAADAKTATTTMLKNVSTSLHQMKDAGVKAKKVAAGAKGDTHDKHKVAGVAAHKVSDMVKTSVKKAGSGSKKKLEV
jgi:hypothetical protein